MEGGDYEPMRKLFILVRCCKCLGDVFDTYSTHVVCVRCGQQYINTRTEWMFNRTHFTTRTDEEKKTDVLID